MDDNELGRLVREALAHHLTPAVSAVTVRDLAALYLASPEAKALADFGAEEGRLRVHILPALGDRDASALTLRDVDEYRKLRWNAAPGTRNRELVRLTKVLRWAADRGHLARYPLPRLKLEPEHNERSTHRSEADIRAVVGVLKRQGHVALAALVATAYDSGLRRREVCRLRWEQIDQRNGVISMAAAETKAKRARATVLSAWALDLIRELPRGEYVFCSRLGRPYHPRTILRYYQRACAELGLEAAPGERNWFHDLRAGFADTQVAIGTSVPHLMAIGGWRDYRTMKRYLRRPPRSIAADATARLNASRRGPKRAPETVRQKTQVERRIFFTD